MQHILVCLDCSELSKQVMPYAVSLARGFGAKITVLHVLEKPFSDFNNPIDCFEWEIQKDEARCFLDSVKADVGRYDVLVDTEIIEGRPAEQINLWINAHHVDLTVLCSHGSNGKSQWSLASTTQKLITGTASAILLVPVQALEQSTKYDHNTSVLFQRVLVPLDGSNWAEVALPFAINIANDQHSELVIAHVIPESGITHIEPLSSEGLALEQKILDYNCSAASHYLNRIESRLKSTSNVSVDTSLISNPRVSHQLIKIIDNKSIDLVVMSAQGNSNNIDQFCGKVALDFLEHCPIPVMLLRGETSKTEILLKSNFLPFESTVRLPSQAAI